MMPQSPTKIVSWHFGHMKKYLIKITTPALKRRFAHPAAFVNRPGIVRAGSLSVLLLIGWLDYITGYEFGFFIFYFIPVAIAAWYCGNKDGICIAIACAACWYFSDRLTHHPYSRAYFIYWEMFIRLISFVTTSMTLSKVRQLVLNEEKMIDELLELRSRLAKFTEDGGEK
jgi:hypothetical protein